MRWETALVFFAFSGVIVLVPFIMKWVITMGDKTRRETQAKQAKASGEKLKNQPLVDIDTQMTSWSRWILGLAVFLLVLAGFNYFGYFLGGSQTNFELALENFGEAVLLGIIGGLLSVRNPFVGLVWIVYIVFIAATYFAMDKAYGFWTIIDITYPLVLGFHLFRGWHYGYFSQRTSFN